MGRKRRIHYKRKVLSSGDGEWEEREQQSEAAIQLIAVSQQSSYIAVAFNSLLQLIRTSEGLPNKVFETSEEVGCIRCLAFDDAGEYLLTGGDDKILRVWQIQQLNKEKQSDTKESEIQSEKSFELVCVYKSKTKKKICAAVFSKCAKFVYIGDKFGDVYAAKVEKSEIQGEPSWVFGHYCAIIGALDISMDGRFLSSCDRDGKVRVNQVSNNPLDGDYEIQSYCLGHTGYVSQVQFLNTNSSENLIILSAGQDGTLRTWNAQSGDQMDVIKLQSTQVKDLNGCDKYDQQHQSDQIMEEKEVCADEGEDDKQDEEEEEEEKDSISCISTYYDQSINKFVIAVVWQQQQISQIGIALCRDNGQFDQEAQSFEQIFKAGYAVKWVQFDGQGCLWMLGGSDGVNLQEKEQNYAKLQIVKGIWKNAEVKLCDFQYDIRSELLDKFVEQNWKVGSVMKKKKYSQEEREQRKQNRNDKKLGMQQQN